MSQLLDLIYGGVVIFQSHLVSQIDHIYATQWGAPTILLIAEPLSIVAASFLLLTIATTVMYYRRIRQASKAYEEAKNVVGDVIISFDKQLNRQEEQVSTTMHKIEGQAANNEKLSRRLDEQQRQITSGLSDLDSKITKLSNIDSIETTLKDLQEKVDGLTRAQDEWKKRAASVTEAQIEAAIPLRRDQALAPLTDTELCVLEFIASSSSGERTAPEVKEMVKLTREHTARLMKKLYEGGYLERRADRTPYTYRVKEEMLRLLKKSEAKT